MITFFICFRSSLFNREIVNISRNNVTGPDEVLNSAQMAISCSQTAIGNIQTTVSIVALFITVIGALSLILVYIFQKIIDKKLSEIDAKTEAANQTAATMDIRKIELDNLSKTKDDLEKKIIDVARRADALDAIFWLKSPDKNTRLTYLLKLTELNQPMGIEPLGQILMDQTEDETFRIQAIRGLKRFKQDWFDQYWDRVKEIFKEVLSIEELPSNVRKEAEEALKIFYL